jgi:hypothetical protein
LNGVGLLLNIYIAASLKHKLMLFRRCGGGATRGKYANTTALERQAHGPRDGHA